MSRLLLAAMVLASAPLAATSPVEVVFRFDDVSMKNGGGVEARIFDIFRERHMPLSIAVIPFSAAPGGDRVRLLREAAAAGWLDIALHGYAHRSTVLTGRPTEFTGLGYPVQLEKIRAGKQFLEAQLHTRVRTLVPPFNGYDGDTVRAAADAGLECLAADLFGSVYPGHIRWLPSTAHVGELQAVVRRARAAAGDATLVAVVMHAYDFAEGPRGTGMPLAQLGDLLDWLRAEGVPVRSISQVLDSGADLSMERYSANRAIQMGARVWLTRSYRRVAAARQMRRLALAGLWAAALAGLIMAYAAGRRWPVTCHVVVCGVFALVCAGLFRAGAVRYEVAWWKAAAICGWAGITGGLWLARMWSRGAQPAPGWFRWRPNGSGGRRETPSASKP